MSDDDSTAAKARGLLDTGATVRVAAPQIHPEFERLEGALHLKRRRFKVRDLGGVHLVTTCTDDPAVTAQMAAEARDRRICVHSADDPANCSFTLPSVARQGDLSVMVSTNGRSPALPSGCDDASSTSSTPAGASCSTTRCMSSSEPARLPLTSSPSGRPDCSGKPTSSPP